MRFLDYMHARTGLHVDVDHYYGAQCTDLVNDYLHQVWQHAGLAGNAIDFQKGPMVGWTWHPNNPSNRPPTGAVVVWNGPNERAGTGAAGHTAIALLSDLDTLLVLEQNWPTNAPVQQGRHSYMAVAGWWAPPMPVLDHA